LSILSDETTDMTDQPRLIERAFPLKQASLDSVHEKNVRHGTSPRYTSGPRVDHWQPAGRH